VQQGRLQEAWPQESFEHAALPGMTAIAIIWKSAACTLHLDRTTNFAGAMNVEQVGSVAGIRVAPVVIPAGQTAAVVTIDVDEGTILPRNRI
jgi:hypothetical protein